ncbi:MAG: hypothetical protein AB1664_12405 [Thermodesulfobacteriota bacterium]
MRKRIYLVLQVWPVIAGLLGAYCWVKFVKLITPHLTRDEQTWAVIFGAVAIVSLSLALTHVFWHMKLYGHLPVSSIFGLKGK